MFVRLTKSTSFKKIQYLGLVLGVMMPFFGHAAVEETQTKEQKDISAAIAPKTSPPENEAKPEKELVNEAVSRGESLYENHCKSCHESLVHIRGAHKVKNYQDIQYWVGRWATELNVEWSADEIDDVVNYLNQSFYHF